MADSGKQKALDTTLASLKKRFGDGAVMKLGAAERPTSRGDSHRLPLA